jgi:hypothetical protein
MDSALLLLLFVVSDLPVIAVLHVALELLEHFMLLAFRN